MQFDILTIFPEYFNSFVQSSLIEKAIKKELIDINVYNLRDWSTNKHKQVDDKIFGGGPGMLLMFEPIYLALRELLGIKGYDGVGKLNKDPKIRVVLFSASGEILKQRKVIELSKYDRVIMVCGRYEGVDHRVKKHLIDEEISIGEYVLFGGEVPAMVLVEGVSRYVKGVIGNEESLSEESFVKEGYLEYPQYTRPSKYIISEDKSLDVPDVLISGDHKKIEDFKNF